MYWSLLRQFRLKKSLRVIWKILGLFVKPLTADEKYSLLNRDNLSQHFQMPLSQKRKIFSEFLFASFRFRLNFEHFPKKKWPSQLIYFWTCGLRKTLLDKRLKSPVSEDSSTSNMINGQNRITVEIRTAAPLLYLLIPVNAI